MPDPRRNPLTPAMERAKKAELNRSARYQSQTLPNQIYIWFYVTDSEHVCYVGKSTNPEQRFADHRAAIKLGVDMTYKYEQARYLKHELQMEVVDAVGEFSENDWKSVFTERGHVLWNEIAGVEQKRHRPKRVQPPIDGSGGNLVVCKAYLDLLDEIQRSANEWRLHETEVVERDQ